MNIMDMSQRDFNNFLLEESQYRSPQEISDLRRRYREENSIFSKIYDYAKGVRQDIEDDGRRLHSFGLTSPQEGAGDFSDVGFSLGGLLSSMFEPAARAMDAPGQAALGNIPAEDMIGEAYGTAGGAMVGGSLVPVRGPALRSNNVRDMFPEDVFHYMRTNNMEGDEIDTSRSFGRVDRLGPHVGTAKAAEDRFGVQFGQDPGLIADYLERTGAETGMTLPLKARLDQPFLNENGQPFSESGLLDVMNRYADQNQIADLDEAAAMFRQDLTDAGFTNIPYVNNLEDRGSVSHIMLTNRTAGDPEVLRSRFAEFEDAYDPSIMAANRSAIGGVLAGLFNPDVNKINKDVLDPGGISKVKLPDYAQNIPFTTQDYGLLEPQRVLDIADLQGSTLIPAYGDRTYGGKLLTHIGDVELTQPVEMQGGHDFMRDMQTGLWASEKSALEPRAKSIQQILDAGEDPLMVYTAMAGQAGDFSHHMSDAVMGLIEQSKITKKAAKEFDDWVKGKGGAKETPGDPNWPGIMSPNAREYLNNNMTGTARRLLWQEMDKSKYLEKGFPHIGAVRAAITDPKLVTARPFDAGLSIGRATGGGLMDLDRPGLRDNVGGVKRHYSYDSQVEGDFLGGLIDSVPAELLYRDFFGERRAAGIKPSGDQRSFMMSPYVRQRVDQQMIDEVSAYLERLRAQNG